ncbi:MAG: hypothetical protein LBJ36_11125 [Synergistaceae bacterium]|nr:hypothetical protein [Synergistaceae bacterium]
MSRGRSVAHLATPESLFPQELAANSMIVQGTAPPRDDENRSVHRFPNSETERVRDISTRTRSYTRIPKH